MWEGVFVLVFGLGFLAFWAYMEWTQPNDLEELRKAREEFLNER